MLYLVNPSTPAIVQAIRDGILGMIDTPHQRNVTAAAEVHAAGAAWCADNGAFTARWSADHWWAWLTGEELQTARPSCLFATAPDVVGDAAATAERSAPWLPRIRAAGYPVAYVGQDGLQDLPWDDFDVLFLGGTDAWKLGPEGRRWAEAAVTRGVPVHMGRVNSRKRMAYARRIGCSTADGTFLTFGPDRRLPEALEWVTAARAATAGTPHPEGLGF